LAIRALTALFLVRPGLLASPAPRGEDREEQDLGVGRALVDGGDDVLDAARDLLGGVLGDAGVVGADHEHDDLRLDAFELAVLDAPEHVLDAVAADAEVHGLVLGVLLLEERLLAVPTGGDGVTEEDDLGFALLGERDEGFVRLHETGLRLAVVAELRGGDIGGLGGQLHRRSLGRGGLGGRLDVGGGLLRLVGGEGGGTEEGGAEEQGMEGLHGVGAGQCFSPRGSRLSTRRCGRLPCGRSSASVGP